jgi:hypothetical protein
VPHRGDSGGLTVCQRGFQRVTEKLHQRLFHKGIAQRGCVTQRGLRDSQSVKGVFGESQEGCFKECFIKVMSQRAKGAGVN